MHRAARTSALAGVAILASISVSATAGGTADKATGGGQILLANGGHGPGDTITFTAQRRADGTVVGNVNVIDRAGTGAGKGYHFRGDVKCIDVEGTVAKIAGLGQGPEGTTAFTLYVQDNGEGAAADDDVIALSYTNASPDCAHDDSDDDNGVDLARGNAQVTDGQA